MAIIGQFEKKYTAPCEDFFKGFLNSIASGTYTPYSRGNSGKDSSFLFIEKLKNNAQRILRIFGYTTELIEKTDTVVDDSDIFTYITFITDLTAPGVSYHITIDRMENGHLGCNEDDIKVKFQYGERLFTLDWYVFTTTDVIFRAEKCSEEEIAQMDKLFCEELGLIPWKDIP